MREQAPKQPREGIAHSELAVHPMHVPTISLINNNIKVFEIKFKGKRNGEREKDRQTKGRRREKERGRVRKAAL